MSPICEVLVQDVITQSPPSVILMELTPSQMQAVGLADAATLLQQLYDLGYTDISHSGYASAGSIRLLKQPCHTFWVCFCWTCHASQTTPSHSSP